MACLFLVNDLAWAAPQDFRPSNNTLAAQSRLSPFFEKHGLDFRQMAAVIYAAGRMKTLIIDGHANDVTIRKEINRLNALFRDPTVLIDEHLEAGSITVDGRVLEYPYAVIRFMGKPIHVLFLKDHAQLTPAELGALRIADSEAKHLDCPGLEGVWFRSPQAPVDAYLAAYEGTVYYPAAGQDFESLELLLQLMPRADRYVFRDMLKQTDALFTMPPRNDTRAVADWLERQARKYFRESIVSAESRVMTPDEVEVRLTLGPGSRWPGRVVTIAYQIGDVFAAAGAYGVIYVCRPGWAGALAKRADFWEAVGSCLTPDGIVLTADARNQTPTGQAWNLAEAGSFWVGGNKFFAHKKHPSPVTGGPLRDPAEDDRDVTVYGHAVTVPALHYSRIAKMSAEDIPGVVGIALAGKSVRRTRDDFEEALAADERSARRNRVMVYRDESGRPRAYASCAVSHESESAYIEDVRIEAGQSAPTIGLCLLTFLLQELEREGIERYAFPIDTRELVVSARRLGFVPQFRDASGIGYYTVDFSEASKVTPQNTRIGAPVEAGTGDIGTSQTVQDALPGSSVAARDRAADGPALAMSDGMRDLLALLAGWYDRLVELVRSLTLLPRDAAWRLWRSIVAQDPVPYGAIEVFGTPHHFPQEIVDRIRPAREEDAPAIAALSKRIYATPDIYQTVEYFKQKITGSGFAGRSYAFWVYTDAKDTVKGYVYTVTETIKGPPDRALEKKTVIPNLALSPKVEGKGIASALMATALAAAGQKEVRRFEIYCQNRGSAEVVERFGFIPEIPGRTDGNYIREVSVSTTVHASGSPAVNLDAKPDPESPAALRIVSPEFPPARLEGAESTVAAAAPLTARKDQRLAPGERLARLPEPVTIAGRTFAEIPRNENVFDPNHATTKAFMRVIDTIDLADTSVLDFGCGSGCLTLQAIASGAAAVDAADQSDEAVWSARRALEYCGVADRARVFTSFGLKDCGIYDVILANLPEPEKPENGTGMRREEDIDRTVAMPYAEFEQFLREAPAHLNKGGYLLLRASKDFAGLFERFGLKAEIVQEDPHNHLLTFFKVSPAAERNTLRVASTETSKAQDGSIVRPFSAERDEYFALFDEVLADPDAAEAMMWLPSLPGSLEARRKPLEEASRFLGGLVTMHNTTDHGREYIRQNGDMIYVSGERKFGFVTYDFSNPHSIQKGLAALASQFTGFAPTEMSGRVFLWNMRALVIDRTKMSPTDSWYDDTPVGREEAAHFGYKWFNGHPFRSRIFFQFDIDLSLDENALNNLIDDYRDTHPMDELSVRKLKRAALIYYWMGKLTEGLKAHRGMNGDDPADGIIRIVSPGSAPEAAQNADAEERTSHAAGHVATFFELIYSKENRGRPIPFASLRRQVPSRMTGGSIAYLTAINDLSKLKLAGLVRKRGEKEGSIYWATIEDDEVIGALSARLSHLLATASTKEVQSAVREVIERFGGVIEIRSGTREGVEELVIQLPARKGSEADPDGYVFDERELESINEKIVRWFHTGYGLRDGDYLVTDLVAAGRKDIEVDKKLASFYILPPGSAEAGARPTVVFRAEDDINHGLVLNCYYLDDFEKGKTTRSLATYVYHAPSGKAVKIDLAATEIGEYYFGYKKVYTTGRFFRETARRSGQGVYVRVTNPRKTQGAGEKEQGFMLPLPPDDTLVGKTVLVTLENDPNHGQVLNAYLESDKKGRRGELLITYMQRGSGDGLPERKADPVKVSALDVIAASEGRELKAIGRPYVSGIQRLGHGGGQVAIPLHRKGGDPRYLRLTIDKKYLDAEAFEKEFVTVVEKDCNHGQVINVYFKDDYFDETGKRRENAWPVSTYKYYADETRVLKYTAVKGDGRQVTKEKNGVCRPVDLRVLDINAYIKGDTIHKIERRPMDIAIYPYMQRGTRNYKASMLKVDMEFMVSRKAGHHYAKMPKPWKAEIALREDPDYGLYIDITKGGFSLGRYYYVKDLGRCTSVNFTQMAFVDYVQGACNKDGMRVGPRMYEHGAMVLPKGHVQIRCRGKQVNFCRLIHMSGSRPVFIPIRDDALGWKINVYEAERYKEDEAAAPDAVLVRNEYFKTLIPEDKKDFFLAKQYYDEGFYAMARHALLGIQDRGDRSREVSALLNDVEGIIARMRERIEMGVPLHDAAVRGYYLKSLGDALMSRDTALAGQIREMFVAERAKDPDGALAVWLADSIRPEGLGVEAYINLAIVDILAKLPAEDKGLAISRKVSALVQYDGPAREALRDALRGYFVSVQDDAAYIESAQDLVPVSKNSRAISSENLYKQDINRFPLLTALGEVKLSALTRLGDVDAREQLISSNLRLARSIAYKYHWTGMPMPELISAANEGLIETAERYEPWREVKFSTYATWWCRQRTQRYVDDHKKTIRIPVHILEKIRKFERLARQAGFDPHDDSMRSETIADAIDMPAAEVDELRSMVTAAFSLDQDAKDKDGDSMGSSLASSIGAGDVGYSKVAHEDLLDAISCAVKTKLSAKKEKRARSLWGIYEARLLPLLSGGESATLEATGRRIDLTSERVRQLEPETIDLMREAILELGITQEDLYVYSMNPVVAKRGRENAVSGSTPANAAEQESPQGSSAAVFELLSRSKAPHGLTGAQIAHAQGDLSLKHTISHDIRALLYLGLIEEHKETGRKTRYYVPEAVKKKRSELLLILSEFHGDTLRPNRKLLDTYKPRIDAIVYKEEVSIASPELPPELPKKLIRMLSAEEAAFVGEKVRDALTLEPFGGEFTADREHGYISAHVTHDRLLYRIGPLVFVVMQKFSTHPYIALMRGGFTAFEEEAFEKALSQTRAYYQDKIADIYGSYPGNIFFIPPYHDIPGQPLNAYDVEMIHWMLVARERFKGATVLDAGSGAGVLSEVALGLGASRAVLIDYSTDKIAAANTLLRKAGYDPADFIALKADLTETEELAGLLKGYGVLDMITICLANIGPWPHYCQANVKTALLAGRYLKALQLFINSGYMHRLPEHENELEDVRAFFEAQGLWTKSYLRSHGIASLIALSLSSPKPQLAHRNVTLHMGVPLFPRRWLDPHTDGVYWPAVWRDLGRAWAFVRAAVDRLFPSLQWSMQPALAGAGQIGIPIPGVMMSAVSGDGSAGNYRPGHVQESRAHMMERKTEEYTNQLSTLVRERGNVHYASWLSGTSQVRVKAECSRRDEWPFSTFALDIYLVFTEAEYALYGGVLDNSIRNYINLQRGSLGRVLFQVTYVDGEPALVIDEIQTTEGFRRLPPDVRGRYDIEWIRFAADLVAAYSRELGFDNTYSLTGDSVRRVGHYAKLNQERNTYEKPFRKKWEGPNAHWIYVTTVNSFPDVATGLRMFRLPSEGADTLAHFDDVDPRLEGFTDFSPSLDGAVQRVSPGADVYVTVSFDKEVRDPQLLNVAMHYGDLSKSDRWIDQAASLVSTSGGSYRFKVKAPKGARDYTFKVSYDGGRTWGWMGWNVSLERAPALDRRPIDAGLSHEYYVEHDMAVKDIVNPGNKDLTVIYGGAGADISHFLLSTNARTGYFVSDYGNGATVLGADTMRDYFRAFGRNRTLQHALRDKYSTDKSEHGAASASDIHTRDKMLLAIGIELEAMGIRPEDVTVEEDHGFPRIKFMWAYRGEKEARERIITFIKGDITKPYACARLVEALEDTFDVYYQRAGMAIPLGYAAAEDNFISSLYEHMIPGGYFVTDDVSVSVFHERPRDCSAAFPLGKGAEVSDCLTPPRLTAAENAIWALQKGRYGEQSSTVTGYGWHVRIRQKLFDQVPPPKGSPAAVFQLLSKAKAPHGLTGGEIAHHQDRLPKTLSYDIRALLYLGLIEEHKEIGRKTRYYVPESVKKKRNEILPILAEFRGKKLRPNHTVLDTYKSRIGAILQSDQPAKSNQVRNLATPGKEALQRVLDRIPSDSTMEHGMDVFSKIDRADYETIAAYVSSFSNLRALLIRYEGHLPDCVQRVLIETRADVAELDTRAGAILADPELAGLFGTFEYSEGHQDRVLQSALLASDRVRAFVKSFMAKKGGADVLKGRKFGCDIATYLAARRTRDAAIAFLSAVEPADFLRSLESTRHLAALWYWDEMVPKLFWYFLAPVYDRLRALGYTDGESGRHMAYLCEHIEKRELSCSLMYQYDRRYWLDERQKRLDEECLGKGTVGEEILESMINNIESRPDGSAATLLTAMRHFKLFRDNPKKDARSVCDAAHYTHTMIPGALQDLVAAGLVARDEAGYYLADWLRFTDVAVVIQECPLLRRTGLGRDQAALRNVAERLRLIEARERSRKKLADAVEIIYAADRAMWSVPDAGGIEAFRARIMDLWRAARRGERYEDFADSFVALAREAQGVLAPERLEPFVIKRFEEVPEHKKDAYRQGWVLDPLARGTLARNLLAEFLPPVERTPRAVDLAKMLRSAVIFPPGFEGCAEITCAVGAGVLVTDETALSRAILNLALRADKTHYHDDKVFVVKAAYADNGRGVMITISDHSVDADGRIFKNGDEMKALLAEAREAVEKGCGGIFSIENNYPRGKVFTIRLPVVTPPGSLASVFGLLSHSKAKHGLTDGEIAHHQDRSLKTLSYDIRALLYLGLIEEHKETGRKTRYYVPESVKKKRGEILSILSEFRGEKLRPNHAILDAYKSRIGAMPPSDQPAKSNQGRGLVRQFADTATDASGAVPPALSQTETEEAKAFVARIMDGQLHIGDFLEELRLQGILDRYEKAIRTEKDVLYSKLNGGGAEAYARHAGRCIDLAGECALLGLYFVNGLLPAHHPAYARADAILKKILTANGIREEYHLVVPVSLPHLGYHQTLAQHTYVMVSEDIILALEGDDDALAFVISHELAHITAGHAEKSLYTMALHGDQDKGNADFWSGLKQAHQKEADNIGLDYAIRAGYAGAGAEKTFAALAALDKEADAFMQRVLGGGKVGGEDAASFRSDALMTERMDALHAKLTGMAPEREAARIHDVNKSADYMRYVPPAERKILCHIVSDAILPVAQRGILGSLEKDMRRKDYTEKVVGFSSTDPGAFAAELAAKMEELRAGCEALYGTGCVVEFDVACSDTKQVEAIQKSMPDVHALAFAPAEAGIDVNGVQVEGIILAMRALRKNDMSILQRIYKFLGGADISPEKLSNIKDISDFARLVTFSLPVFKLDGRENKRLNDLIRDAILTAA